MKKISAERRKVLTILAFGILVWAILLFFTFDFTSEAQKAATARKDQEGTSEKTDSTNQTIAPVSVIIDAGHGDYDDGLVAEDGSKEKDLTLNLVLKIGKELGKMDSNITVLYTRDSDEIHFSSSTKNDETGRINVANNSEADYFLSIHMARDDDTQKTGYSGYTREDDTSSQTLYVDIAKELTEVGWTPDLGINYVNNEPEVIANQTERPSLLIEIGFITNVDEVNELNQEEIQDILAKAIATGYYNYLKSLN